MSISSTYVLWRNKIFFRILIKSLTSPCSLNRQFQYFWGLQQTETKTYYHLSYFLAFTYNGGQIIDTFLTFLENMTCSSFKLFLKENKVDISSKLSPEEETIWMKCQTLSPVKNKKNICNLLSADLANKVKINQESKKKKKKKKKNTLR